MRKVQLRPDSSIEREGTVEGPRGELLNYQATADYLNMCRGTLQSLVSRKQIPHVRFGKRLVFFERSALEAWIASKRVLPGGSK